MIRLRFAALLFASSVGLCATDETPPTPKWFYDITRVAYTDLPNIQTLGDWPEKLIEDCAKAGVQLFISRAHSGEHWNELGWKSAVGKPDPKMGDRDRTREVVALCRKHGIRYIPYYWAQREPASVAEAHPDWRCVNSKGKPTSYLCMNTPYRDLVRNRIVELVKEVGVDGIFFDMFHARSDECYCAACKAKFSKETGQEPPLKEDFDSVLWQQWTNFKYRSIESAMLEFNRAIKAANPEAALLVNSWNAWVYRQPDRTTHNIRNSIRVAEVVDGMLEETGWYDTVDPSFFAFPALHNFMSWHLGGLCKDKRAFMWSSPSYMRTQPVGYTEAAIRVLAMMANGSVPAQSVPGRDVMARYMADIAARDECFRNDRLHPWCGLVVSEKTELWYGRNDPKNRYVKGIYGAFQTMMERHLPVSLVTDRDLERGKLDGCKVLFMPNCAAMSDAEMETVRRFVRNGGGLVATYETSLYDEHAKPRDTFGLADVLNAKKTGAFDCQRVVISWDVKHQHGAHLHLAPQHRWASDPVIRETLMRHSATQPLTNISYGLPLNSRMLLVEPVKGGASPMRIATATADKKTGEVKRTNTPAIIESTYGKGKVIYLPDDISTSFFRFGHEHWARMMELALRETASAPPPVEVTAPRLVQAMTHTQGNRLVVHLLNDVSSLGRSQNVAGESLYERREVIPIHDITLTFRDRSLRRFQFIPGNTELKAAQTKDGWLVTVPRLNMHGMVVAE
ncbi:MAG: beta-galactosidase trimerization domain-containing protein [Verrucomicrobia bacterium]|nr:beta-galactosidase trimerization domain-containing protein [Verrucomicrobiota bacterium]